MAEQENDFVSKVTEMGKELGLEGEKLEEYIEQHLTKKGGFKKVVSWVEDDKGNRGGSGSGKSGSWF